jgi:flagellar protein FliS
MLFDGLLSSLAEARGAMERGQVEEKGRHIGRAVRIIEEGLMGSLNHAQGGEVATNLAALYSYCSARLTLANLHNDASLLDEVVGLVTPVADGWRHMPQPPESGR